MFSTFTSVAAAALVLASSIGSAKTTEPKSDQTKGSSMPMPPKAKAIIDHFGMENIPHEGPWFIQTHKSDDLIEGRLAERYTTKRYAYTAIYALFTAYDFSGMHRLATDELWHYYGGSPSKILMLHPDGRGEVKVLGGNILEGEEPQIMVPRGTWMGARPMGDPATAYTLGGNTLSPGFEYQDYEPGYRDELTKLYPKFAKEIEELTRADSITRPKDDRPIAALVPPVDVKEWVGRTASQKSDQISMAQFTVQAGGKVPMMVTKQGHEVVVVTAGEGMVTVGDKAQSVRQGSVIYLPPKIPHEISAKTRLEFYVAVSPAWQQSDTELVKD
jgi:uncharacterized protein